MLIRRSYSMILHGPLGDYGANQAAKWRNARFQIVITQALKRAVLDTLPCVNERYLYVAPMGIDPLCFSRSRPYLPYAPGQPLEIFSCARLNRAKGHAVLFEVIAMLRKGGLDVRLTVAGEDDAGGSGYRSDLERMVTERGLSAVVTLLGAVSEERVRAELERCHIFALLSDAEPLGVAYMEAMSMEIPVLGTRAGGVPELIQDGIHGILVAPRDAAGAHDAILRMIGEPQAMIRMGLKARGRVIEGFSSSHSARTLLAACGETLSESRSAS
jgi:glycosyltransferase involved in cell wall biosynthesis